MKSVSVVFANSSGVYNVDEDCKVYEYLCDLKDIAIDDLVAVKSAFGWKIVKVTRLHDVASTVATAYVVCKIDVDAHTKRLASEVERKELLAALEALEAKRQQLQRFEALASESEEAKELLSKLKAL